MTPETADSLAREVYAPLQWLTDEEARQILGRVYLLLDEKRRREARQRRTYG